MNLKTLQEEAREFQKKYFPTHGCDNCLGDLHEGCSEKCKSEFRAYGECSRIMQLIDEAYALGKEEQRKKDAEIARKTLETNYCSEERFGYHDKECEIGCETVQRIAKAIEEGSAV